MPRHWFKRWLPSPEQIKKNRFIARFAPGLADPKLWFITRRGVALGVAVGFFFGFMVPVAQTPAAAATAFIFRFHLPTACFATLISNPLTYAPIYWAAYQVGSWLLGVGGGSPVVEQVSVMAQIAKVGGPLFLGLFVFAVVSAIVGYVLVQGAWVASVRWARHRRLRRYARMRAAAGAAPNERQTG